MTALSTYTALPEYSLYTSLHTVICQFHCNCTFPYPCSENTYKTVEPKESAALSEHIAMETNPAYASVDMTTAKT